jgi:hypothetical protein
MFGEKLSFLIAVAAVLHSFGQIYGQVLEAKLAGARLSTGLSYSTSVYDGIDSVFIFGG